MVIPTWVYAILWRSSFVYTSALIRKSYNSLRTSRTTINHTLHDAHDYQSHSARLYKKRKTPTSEHSCVITLHKLILAPPRGDDIYPPQFKLTTEPLVMLERSFVLPLMRLVSVRASIRESHICSKQKFH